VAGSVGGRHSRTPATGNESDQEDFNFPPTLHRVIAHAAQIWRPFDLIGIAIDRAQTQYPMGAMLGGAKSAPNRCHRPDA
jgi:hypothetical protein